MDNTRLHPLLTAAAVSLTVFSAVGVASLTGLVPASIGSPSAPAIEIPKAVAKPLEPAIAHPVAKPAAKTIKKPALKNVGTVESVRQVMQAGEHTAIGPVAGGVVGAVIGNQFGHGNGKRIMTVLGAAGGALAGREIEKQARATQRWAVEVRLDDGTQQTVLSPVAPAWQVGQRVRVIDGTIQPV